MLTTASVGVSCWPTMSFPKPVFKSSYDEALPVGRHYIGKDHTQHSESNNSRQRHWLARFRRRTCVVSRSVEMVDATMALFAFYHCNGGSFTPALVG